jgi:DNA-directed RNA polymerase specialized sigma24 family protein
MGTRPLSCAELAEKGRVPIGTVMGRLARCREALKQRLVKALEGGKA